MMLWIPLGEKRTWKVVNGVGGDDDGDDNDDDDVESDWVDSDSVPRK
jgi:phosphopantothenoylcysteine synthetase/decarboxylase